MLGNLTFHILFQFNVRFHIHIAQFLEDDNVFRIVFQFINLPKMSAK